MLADKSSACSRRESFAVFPLEIIGVICWNSLRRRVVGVVDFDIPSPRK